jgi:hypothetical protein
MECSGRSDNVCIGELLAGMQLVKVFSLSFMTSFDIVFCCSTIR